MHEERIPVVVFRDCDIRGLRSGDEISDEFAYLVGRAIGTIAHEGRAVIGGDFRQSTPELLAALERGMVESGARVFNVGQLTTPAYYFARRHLNVKTGVMVTASHNPPLWNGFKPILGDLPITPAEIVQLKDRVVRGDFTSGHGSVERIDVKADYVGFLAARFAGLGAIMPRAVFDCGNGATGWVMRDVIDALGLNATILFEQPDGAFPNRTSDISRPGDLAALQTDVQRQGAGIGFGFDGDGDRVGAVDERGQRVESDRLIAWLSEELLARAGGGTIVYDLKLSRLVPDTIRQAGGKAVAQKSGHTFIKSALMQEDAIMGGEYSGHIFYREIGAVDDALFSALLIGSLLGEKQISLSQSLAYLPTYVSSPDLRARFSGDTTGVFDRAADDARAQGASLIRMDGVRAEYADGWALMRASVTEPALTFRFEGKTKADMLAVARRFTAGVDVVGEQVWQQVEAYAARLNE